MGALSGRAGVVTGGGRGIGRAISLELARHGAGVGVGYNRDRGAADAVVEEIRAMGSDAIAIQGSVQTPEEVADAIARAAEHFGRIDYLVNNAGITRDRSLTKMTFEEWNDVIEVNLHSVFHVTKQVLPHMLEAKYGRIVNISSIIGLHGGFGQANYATAKAGIIGFTKTAAIELAAKGITVNAIAPGFIETEMVAAMPEEAGQKVQARIPMGRFGRPEEVGQAAFYLIAYGDYITGQVLQIDGGLHT